MLVSAWVHFYLYFRGGYRGIAPESLLGITVSRAFVVNAIAGVVIAEVLVLATRFERLVLPAAAAGVLFAVGTLAAFFMSRWDTLLGFHETEVTHGGGGRARRRGRRARRARPDPRVGGARMASPRCNRFLMSHPATGDTRRRASGASKLLAERRKRSVPDSLSDT